MKYLEGNIFINFYIFGAAGIAAVFIGGYLYTTFGLRRSFLISFIMCIIGCIGMLVIQLKIGNFSSQEAREQFEE
jgi:MFS family permease